MSEKGSCIECQNPLMAEAMGIHAFHYGDRGLPHLKWIVVCISHLEDLKPHLKFLVDLEHGIVFMGDRVELVEHPKDANQLSHYHRRGNFGYLTEEVSQKINRAYHKLIDRINPEYYDKATQERGVRAK